MRIAFVSTILSYPWGGADTLWTRAGEAAVLRGDRVLAAVSPAVAAHPRIAALVARGASHFLQAPPAAPTFLQRVARKLGFAQAPDSSLTAAVRRFQPDLVLISQGGTYDVILIPALMTWLVATKTKFRLIANWQEEKPNLSDSDRNFVRRSFLAADRLVFVSTRNLAVTRQHLDLPLPNATVVHNPLRWRPEDVTPWPGAKTLRLATVSRLEAVKGLPLLLQALAAARAELPDWHLTIYGRGPDESRLTEMARQLGLAEQVTLAGYVTDLRSIWSREHMLVSPSIDEGVPMTIPEAMLCERPVLATRVGGAEDWLEHDRTGFLCPMPDIASLAARLREAMAAAIRWPEMGRAASEAARRRYRPLDYLQLIS